MRATPERGIHPVALPCLCVIVVFFVAPVSPRISFSRRLLPFHRVPPPHLAAAAMSRRAALDSLAFGEVQYARTLRGLCAACAGVL